MNLFSAKKVVFFFYSVLYVSTGGKKTKGTWNDYPDKKFFPSRSQVINTGEEII